MFSSVQLVNITLDGTANKPPPPLSLAIPKHNNIKLLRIEIAPLEQPPIFQKSQPLSYLLPVVSDSKSAKSLGLPAARFATI